MSHEEVLEDVLRTRAADVELDPGALAAILSAPAPTNEGRPERSQQSSSHAASTAAAQAAASGGGSGSSILGTVAKVVGGGLVAVVAATVLYAGVAGTTTHCPGLDRMNGYVNAEILALGGGEQGVMIPCNADTLDFSDVKDSAPPGIHADLDANQEDIQDVLDCINETATPLSLSTLLDKIPDVCIDQLG